MKVLVLLIKNVVSDIHPFLCTYLSELRTWLYTSCSDLFLWGFWCGGYIQVCYLQLLVLCNISHLSLEHMYTYRYVLEVWRFDVGVIHQVCVCFSHLVSIIQLHRINWLLHNILFFKYLLGLATTWRTDKQRNRTIWTGAWKTILDIWRMFLWYDLSSEGAA